MSTKNEYFAQIVTEDGNQYIKLTKEGDIKMKAYQIWRLFFGIVVFSSIIAILGMIR